MKEETKRYEKEDSKCFEKFEKEAECGELKIKAENVYITIVCKNRKEEDF